MARKLDDAQQQELTQFANAIAAVAGYPSSAEWARDSGYAYVNLTKLRAATGAVDGYNLLRLIRAAAARSEATPEALAVAVAKALGTADADESIADRLKELADLITEVLTRLDVAAQRQRSEADRSPEKAAR